MHKPMEFPDGKRYNTFVGYYRRRYGERLQKLVLDAGFTCPNRDGKVGRGGCTFCDNAAFHPGYSIPGKSLAEQIEEGIVFHRVRYPRAAHYLAYFQSYSNTYADLETLRGLYCSVLGHPSVVGIVIGTRPDCVDGAKLDFLADLARGAVLPGWRRCLKDGSVLTSPVVVVEYGIESCHDKTLARINRGHDFECACRAVRQTAERGIDTGAHFILGLPGETTEDMVETARRVAQLPLDTIKIHQLQLIRGTRLAKQVADGSLSVINWTVEEYIKMCARWVEIIPSTIAIERFVSQSPSHLLISPKWGLKNYEFTHLLHNRLKKSRELRRERD